MSGSSDKLGSGQSIFFKLFLTWQDPLVGSDRPFALFESCPSIGGFSKHAQRPRKNKKVRGPLSLSILTLIISQLSMILIRKYISNFSNENKIISEMGPWARGRNTTGEYRPVSCFVQVKVQVTTIAEYQTKHTMYHSFTHRFNVSHSYSTTNHYLVTGMFLSLSTQHLRLFPCSTPSGNLESARQME